MSENFKPVKGDRVRVVLEGPVGYAGTTYFEIGDDNQANAIYHAAKHVVSIEKIEPPVTVFKPGDRLRPKRATWDYELTLASEGYLQHFQSDRVEYYEYVGGEREGFTSETYDKIEFAEKPF